jgi:hypothetical protein
MKRNKFSETRKENIKCAACIGLMSVSKICSFSKMMPNKPVSERKKPTFDENKTLGVETHQKENYDNVVCKTPIFSLPSLIRIRATDREGNTIEVTY